MLDITVIVTTFKADSLVSTTPAVSPSSPKVFSLAALLSPSRDFSESPKSSDFLSFSTVFIV